ncbi:MAG: flippase [Thermoplasmata archaeon]|nr:flippase [Thermoplasmata archaeon]
MDQAFERDSVSRGIVYQYANSITILIAGFLFYIYIIHFFPPEIVGAVALLLAIASLFNIVFTLGLGSGVQHFISYHLGRNEPEDIHKIIRKFSMIALMISFISLIFIWFSAPFFEDLFFHTNKYTMLIRFLGFDLFAMVLNTILGGMLIGLQNFKSQAIRNIIGVIISYSSPIIFFIFTKDPLVIVIGWTLGNATSAILVASMLYKRIKKLGKVSYGKYNVRAVFYYSMPIFISSLIGYGATYVDRFTVSYFLNLTELGIYNFGLLIVSAIGFIVSPFGSILLPKFSEFFGRNDINSIRIFSSKAVELLLTIYLPVALLIAAISSPILLFLSSSQYLPATIPIIIILLINSIFIIANVFGPALQAIRKTRIFIISSGLALASNFILSVILIPPFKMVGAAIGFSSIYVVSFFILYYFMRKYDLISFERIKILKIYISGFLMFIIMFLIQHLLGYSILRLILYIVLGFAIYIIFLKAFRIFNNEDLEFFMFLLPKRLQKLRKIIRILILP